MPDDYVTLPPMTREEAERLISLCEMERTIQPAAERLGLLVFDAPVRDPLADKLRSALEEPGEVRREYRVAGEKRNKNVRIQHRTVTETPWRDLEEGEWDGE